MENFETRLFDLIETKGFESLNSEEKDFVLEHCSEEEYRFQRKIIAESSELDYEIPAPVAMPQPKKVFLLRRTIPLYQALLAAASVALLVYIFRPAEEQKGIQYTKAEKSFTDTVYSSVTIHDTTVKIIEVVRFQEKILRDTISIAMAVFAPKETRMLEAGKSFPLASIRPAGNEKTGSSMSDDKTIALLPKMVNSGVFDVNR